jgi:cytochrome b561
MSKSFGAAFSARFGKAGRYNRGARLFHWLIALMIAGMFLTNTMRESYERGSALRDGWLVAHASLGISIFILTLARIIWRLTSKVPAPVPGSPLLHLGARLGHLALYGFTFCLPLTGFLRLTSSGATIPLYGLIPVPSPTGKNDTLHKLAALFHNDLWMNLLLALIALHVAAALFHQFVLKDGTLRRML